MKEGFLMANVDAIASTHAGMPLTIVSELKSANRKLRRIEIEHQRERVAREDLVERLEEERELLQVVREEIADTVFTISQAMRQNFTVLWEEMATG
jgi:ubiquinone biosynthesis protein COQ9